MVDPPPCYSVYSFDQDRAHNQFMRDQDERRVQVLRAYTLIMVLILTTMSLVALSKLLPASLSTLLYTHHWIYYVSGILMAASLIVLALLQTSGWSKILNDCWLLLLWGSSTINLILIGKHYTLNAVYLAGCLTIVSAVCLTLLALQLRTDLTKKSCELLVLLCGLGAFVVTMTVLRGGEDAKITASAAWIATSVVLLPFVTQVFVGGRKLELDREDFILAVAILFTLIASSFQHILIYFSM
ncbi:Hypothetical predicted protein [Cloeon dipterum]|uniref:Uncharacterized protein n=1 Tax=Cloeon dipterum TaxID=197152 RepID=A0A8S1C9Z9_9INSE|nr:Hypothetical predicted protein [Cloeon dipterum]